MRREQDLTEYLRFQLTRGYYVKRNAVAFILAFLWITTLTGLYAFDLWLATPLILGAMGAWALVRSRYGRFRDYRRYFLAEAVVDNLVITVAIYLFGGAGSAAIMTFYTYPIIYHSLTRNRLLIYLIANIGAVMYSTMLSLEGTGVLPYRNVFGFQQPPPITYLGLMLGGFLMLNLSALVGDTVTQVFAKLWNVKRNLQKSQRRLRELTSETEFIASAISHELKNPLSAAANAADLLIAEAGTATPDDVREFAGIVHHNVTKAYDMLTELRQVVVAANRDERPEEIALDRLVHNVVNEALRRSDRLAPQIRIAGELPLIEGQPQKVSQVFRNLLENALEHARTSTHPIVRVDGLGPDTQSGFLRFAVSDNGPGVPEEHRERIFEPFVTLGEGLREGRGLGLALVRRIIREGGGNIWVERSDLGGARFVFTLPRSAEANPSDVEDEPEGPES